MGMNINRGWTQIIGEPLGASYKFNAFPIHELSTGIFLILIPDSVIVTIAPFFIWNLILGQTLLIRSAKSGPFRPSNRIRITEGAEAFVKARIAWKSESRVIITRCSLRANSSSWLSEARCKPISPVCNTSHPSSRKIEAAERGSPYNSGDILLNSTISSLILSRASHQSWRR